MTVESMVASQGLELPPREIVMTLSSARAVLHAVERGIGLGWCTIRAFESGQILGAVPVRIAEIRFNRQLHVIHRRGQLGDIPRAFLQWLRDERSEVIDEEVEQTARVISDGGPAGFKPGTATQPSP
jgi:DNA-binding transcriptional LysR family regulator